MNPSLFLAKVVAFISVIGVLADAVDSALSVTFSVIGPADPRKEGGARLSMILTLDIDPMQGVDGTLDKVKTAFEEKYM